MGRLTSMKSGSKSKTSTTPGSTTSGATVETVTTRPTAAPVVAQAESAIDYSKIYRERKNSGEVVLHFNKGLEDDSSTLDDANRSELASVELIAGIPGTGKFRYMYDKLQQRTDYTSDRLVNLGEELLERHSLGYSQPVGTVLGSEAVYVGRIITESVHGDSRLNVNSILLEGFGDEDTQKSAIVKLRVAHSVKHAFFPGQIVAVKGTMKDGELVTNEVFSDTCTPVDYDPARIKQSTRIIVACGPFTTEDNLSFEPLKDLMQRITRDKVPDVLLLVCLPLLFY